MKLIFATSNLNKAKEISNLSNGKIEILTLKDIGFTGEIAETGVTLLENAHIKSRYVKKYFGEDCLADDSGLEVEGLNGEPGVYSARYAGEPKNDQLNNEHLLKKLFGHKNRKARFRTVISLQIKGEEFVFEGVLNGVIADLPIGNGGFGYDPIFIPEGFSKTLAELSLKEKNEISHRAIAFNKLMQFLQKIN